MHNGLWILTYLAFVFGVYRTARWWQGLVAECEAMARPEQSLEGAADRRNPRV